jgi:hypothetical protein
MFNRMSDQIRRYTLIAIVFASFSVAAQNVSVRADIGIGSYSHSELKYYQEDLRTELSLNRDAVVKSFPSYLTYAIAVEVEWKHWMIGGEIGHGSTGGRIYYEDYSGRFVSDQLVTYNYIAVVPSAIVHRDEKWLVALGAEVNFVFNNLRIKNELAIGSQVSDADERFKATTAGIQPNVRVRRMLGKKTFVQCTLGYELQRKGVALWSKNNDAHLERSNGDPIHLQGSGFRVALAIGIFVSQ